MENFEFDRSARQTLSVRAVNDSAIGVAVTGFRVELLRYADAVSISQRLYPDSNVTPALLKRCFDARFVYNLGLEERNLWHEARSQKITCPIQAKELAEARKAFLPLEEGSSSVQQQALRELDRAFRNWWRNPQHFSPPTWRKADVNECFYIRVLEERKLNRNTGEVLVPKAGWVRFRLSRSWPEIEASSSARVTLDRSGRWHVSFTQAAPSLELQGTAAPVGLDMGIAATVTTSDGIHLCMAKLASPGEAQRKRRLQRKKARQKKCSNRRSRTKLSARESDRCRDWTEKTTTALVRDYDFIAIEDLPVRNMVRSATRTLDNPGRNVARKRGLNGSIQSQAWSLFRQRLKDKRANATHPVLVIAVNSKFTSQACPQCGNTTAENPKSQALFSCATCGHRANAGINAARNILAAGLGPLWGVAGRRGTPHAKSAMTDHSGPMKRQLLKGSAPRA